MTAVTPAPPREVLRTDLDLMDGRCSATSKGSGERCKRRAIAGGAVCTMHGGKAKQVREAAQRRLAEKSAADSLAEYGYDPVPDPIAKMADLTAQACAIVDYWAAHVPQIKDVRYQSEKGIEQLRSEVVLYERAMDRAERFLKDLVQLGFEERRVALAEEDARRVADVILAVVDGLFGLLDGKVKPTVLVELRREAVPGLVQRAIETTAA